NEVHGCLVRRIMLYGASCAIYFSIILVCSELLSESNYSLETALARCLDEMMYWLPGIAILAPMVGYDILRLTNRFTGPFFRLKVEMQHLVDQDDDRPPLTFRQGDYWSEVAVIFNQLREELQELRAEKARGFSAADQAESHGAAAASTGGQNRDQAPRNDTTEPVAATDAS
ncbi:MAG: hypothetical protein MI861_28550, partial [Pirellulales bacterium]|nr:hypothetical protein [Pirellulales bacterium]